MGMSWWQIIQIVNRPEGKHPEGEPAKWQTSISQVSHKSCILYTEHIIAASDSMGILHIHCVSKKTGPVTFSNNSNNPTSISTNFGTKNRQLIGT